MSYNCKNRRIIHLDEFRVKPLYGYQRRGYPKMDWNHHPSVMKIDEVLMQ